MSRRAGDGVANLSAENARILAKNLNEVGKRTAEAGVKLSFHPHCWTLVEREPELKMIMGLTDPKLASWSIWCSIRGTRPWEVLIR